MPLLRQERYRAGQDLCQDAKASEARRETLELSENIAPCSVSLWGSGEAERSQLQFSASRTSPDFVFCCPLWIRDPWSRIQKWQCGSMTAWTINGLGTIQQIMVTPKAGQKLEHVAEWGADGRAGRLQWSAAAWWKNDAVADTGCTVTKKMPKCQPLALAGCHVRSHDWLGSPCSPSHTNRREWRQDGGTGAAEVGAISFFFWSQMVADPCFLCCEFTRNARGVTFVGTLDAASDRTASL